jgi:hypothetical protein
MIPKEIGRYQIREEMPGSTWANTYRAYDPEQHSEVVVKVIKGRYLYTPSDQKKLEEGVLKINLLNHPAISPILDFGEDDRSPYFVVPLMPGSNLTTRLASKRFSVAEAVEMFKPLAEALDYAADHEIIHHNLKPNNILFDEHDRPQIAELGIQQVIGTLSAARMPTSNPPYANPEQARNMPPDRRSQVYSLATIIYEALTGRTVFIGATDTVTLFKHTSERPHPPSEHVPGIPEAIDDVMLKALEKYPDRRYPSATKFMDALAAASLEVIPPDGFATYVEEAYEPEPAIPPAARLEDQAGARIQPTPSIGGEVTSALRWIMGVSCLAFSLVIGGIGLITAFVVRNNTEQTNAMSTQTAVAATAVAEEMQLKLGETSEWPLLVIEDFDDNKLEWHEGDVQDEYTSMTLTIDGQYTWQATALRGFTWRVWPSTDYVADFFLSVDAKNAGENQEAQYGLIFRNNDDNFFFFEVRDTQVFRVLRMYRDDWEELIPATFSPAILMGEFNRLTVIAEGDDFTFLINGQYAGETTGESPQEGQAGLAIGLTTAGEECTIVFDNFELRAPLTEAIEK